MSKSLPRFCFVVCTLVMLLQLVKTYPLDDDHGITVIDGTDSGLPEIYKRRRMGWSLCNRFFKWRCGKTSRVIHQGHQRILNKKSVLTDN